MLKSHVFRLREDLYDPFVLTTRHMGPERPAPENVRGKPTAMHPASSCMDSDVTGVSGKRSERDCRGGTGSLRAVAYLDIAEDANMSRGASDFGADAFPP